MRARLAIKRDWFTNTYGITESYQDEWQSFERKHGVRLEKREHLHRKLCDLVGPNATAVILKEAAVAIPNYWPKHDLLYHHGIKIKLSDVKRCVDCFRHTRWDDLVWPLSMELLCRKCGIARDEAVRAARRAEAERWRAKWEDDARRAAAVKSIRRCRQLAEACTRFAKLGSQHLDLKAIAKALPWRPHLSLLVRHARSGRLKAVKVDRTWTASGNDLLEYVRSFGVLDGAEFPEKKKRPKKKHDEQGRTCSSRDESPDVRVDRSQGDQQQPGCHAVSVSADR